MGHFPYAHSLKELPLLDHEILTGRYVMSEPLCSIIKENLGTEPETVAAIVDKTVNKNVTDEIVFFRNILSGVLDPDKLDYLNRDAYYCGVPYGIQDIDFIISNIVPHSVNGIAVTETGLPAVENILFSKYLMYKAVYWHKTVRSATAMVKKALFLGIKDGIIKPEELYGLDDETLFSNYRKSTYTPFSLLRDVAERKIFKTVTEIPFDMENSSHHCLTFLDKRLSREKDISEMLKKYISGGCGSESVIIDIPEQISFEVNLPVVNDAGTADFTASVSVFNRPVIKGFTEALRKIRVFAHESVASSPLPVQLKKDIAELVNSGC